MIRFRPAIVGLVSAVLLSAPAVHAAGLPRITIASSPNSEPPALEVVELLEEQLGVLDIAVDPWEVNPLPSTPEEWRAEGGRAAAKVAGTVALFGYECGEKACRLFVVDPRSESLLELPVPLPEGDSPTTAFALAATAREALLGPLFPELERLAEQGKNPAPPPPSPESVWTRPPVEDERQQQTDPERQWLWIEGGYQGEHGHPDGHPIHGPWLGLEFEPRRAIGIALSVGWLGIRRGEAAAGEVNTNRLTTELALRVILPLGPAHVAVAPVGRLDVVFADLVPESDSSKSETDVDIQVGGMTTWHLPMTRRLEAMVGAGVLASVLSNRYGFDGPDGEFDTVVPASTLRLVWVAGICFSPL